MRPMTRLPRSTWVSVAASIIGVAVAAVANVAPRADEAPYHLVPGWGQLASPLTWGETPAITLDASGRVFAFTRADPPIIEFDASGKRPEDVGREDVRVAARHPRRSQRLPVDHRRPRARTASASRCSSSHATASWSMTLGTAGVAGDSPDTFNGRDRRGRRAERRHLRLRRPRQLAHREVLEGRQVHQDVGQERRRSRRVQRAAHDLLRLARPPVGRRSIEPADSDLRSGRELPRSVDAVRIAERHLHRARRHALRRGLQRQDASVHRQRERRLDPLRDRT